MAPARGERATEVLQAARSLLEERGHDGLRVRELADRLGIKPPTLYAHFRSKGDLENALIAQGLVEQADAAERALDGTPPEDDIPAMWAGYRDWAIRNPGLYMLTASRSLDRDNPEVAAAERVGAAMVLRSVGGDRSTAVAFWGFAFGLIALEINDRVPPGNALDAIWATGLRGLMATLPG
jgi:AcrR family transcriptional regulator